jgi:hypothetical protein
MVSGHLLKNWIKMMIAQIIGPEVDIMADEEFVTSQALCESEVATYELLYACPVVYQRTAATGKCRGPVDRSPVHTLTSTMP